MYKTIIVLVVSIGFLNSCYYDKSDKLYPSNSCDTVKMTYTQNIKPIIQTNCLDKGCHTSSNASGSIELETYAGVNMVNINNALINSLKYVSGGSKNMPPTGKLSDCDIQKVEAWIRRGAPEN